MGSEGTGNEAPEHGGRATQARSAFLRTVVVGALVASCAAPWLLSQAPPSSAKPEPIVIAVEAPLSGPQANNGIDMLRGVRLAVRQRNAKGGIDGRRIRIVPIDDQADPKLALVSVDAAKKAGAMAVIGPYNSSVGVINLPAYAKAGIVAVQMTSTDETNGMGVTVQPKNSQIAPVEFAHFTALGAKKVTMLVDPSTYTQGMADRLAAQLRAAGVKVRQFGVAEGLSSYSGVVDHALAWDPDAVYVSTYYPEGATIARRLAKANAKVPRPSVFGMGNVDPSFVTQAGLDAARLPVFSGVPESSRLPGKRAAAYSSAFAQEFGAAPGVWGIFTYDSANLLFDTMITSKATKPGPLLAALRATKKHRGATGKTTIDPRTGSRVNAPVYLLGVQEDGSFAIIS